MPCFNLVLTAQGSDTRINPISRRRPAGMIEKYILLHKNEEGVDAKHAVFGPDNYRPENPTV